MYAQRTNCSLPEPHHPDGRLDARARITATPEQRFIGAHKYACIHTYTHTYIYTHIPCRPNCLAPSTRGSSPPVRWSVISARGSAARCSRPWGECGHGYHAASDVAAVSKPHVAFIHQTHPLLPYTKLTRYFHTPNSPVTFIHRTHRLLSYTELTRYFHTPNSPVTFIH